MVLIVESTYGNRIHPTEQTNQKIKEDNPKIPVYIFGHSMGSFVVRNFIMNPKISVAGAILSGTGGNPGILGNIGLMLTKMIMIFKPAQSPSPLMDTLSFGKFNAAFKPNRTKFDWLSRDNIEVDKYIGDPFCGTIFSVGFFKDLLTGVRFVNNQKNMEQVPEDLPILMFSGAKDPVGNNGQGVTEVYNKLKKAGVKNMTMRLFEEGRHEMLNEINKMDVYQFILDWLQKN